jgi:small subunit ribosomal protein S1
MSWTKKINHPSELLKKGDKVEAVVLSVSEEKKRVALGLKQLERDPWQGDIQSKYKPGQTAKGKITKLTSFGAFVELEPDLEGLLHISEMSDKKVEKPEEVAQVGQEVGVVVLRVDVEARKIGLSMRAGATPGVETPDPTEPASKPAAVAAAPPPAAEAGAPAAPPTPPTEPEKK